MRLRKTETDAIKALLADEWESEDDLVKGLYEKVLELLEERDLWGISWGSVAYGVFTDRRQAEKLTKQFDEACFAAPIVAVATLRRASEKANPKQDPKHCPSCGCPKFAHNVIVIRGVEQKGCLARGCSCPEVFFSKSWDKKSLIAKGAFSGGQITAHPEDEDEDD